MALTPAIIMDFTFQQGNDGSLTQAYSYVTENGDTRKAHAVLNRTNTTQAYMFYIKNNTSKIGLFDVNHATEATLSVSSTHTVPNYHFQQLFQDQNYLYLVTTKIFVFDPATLNLVTEISGPSASDGTFQPINYGQMIRIYLLLQVTRN